MKIEKFKTDKTAQDCDLFLILHINSSSKVTSVVTYILHINSPSTTTTEINANVPVTLLSMISAFLFYDPEKVPAMFKDLNADHQRMFDQLKKEDTLKWIAVLPPHIADTPSGPYTVKHDSSPGRAISKRDLGTFLVESLNNPEHYQQVCGLATTVQSSS